MRRGDTLYITTIDRLRRSKEKIKEALEKLKKNGIIVKILDIPTTMADFPESSRWVQEMVTNVILEVLTRTAEYLTLERQEERINAAIEKRLNYREKS